MPSAEAVQANPNRYLWNNHGIWFLALTVYPTPQTKERLRFSLCTTDVEVARERRDILLRLPPQRLLESKRNLVVALFLPHRPRAFLPREARAITTDPAAEMDPFLNRTRPLANEVWMSL